AAASFPPFLSVPEETNAAMDFTPKVMVIGPDRSLTAETAAAFAGIADMRANVHHVGDYRQGIESLRNRRPALAFFEMTSDLGKLKTFVEEAAIGSPETAVVAVFRPDIFGPEVSESSIIIDAVRAGVQDLLRRPLSTPDLEQLLIRLDRRSHRPTHCSAGRIISFISNKGGVGKSTLAVNVATGLAQRHAGRVLLVDASLQMGVCAAMLDVSPATTITDVARQRRRVDERLLQDMTTTHSSGLQLLASPKDAVEATEIDDEIITRILTLARRIYDFIIVDTFPMIDRVLMAILDMTKVGYIVTESVVPTLLGSVKMFELLNQLEFPPEHRRLIVNRYSNFAGNLKVGDVATRLGQPVAHVVPYEKKLLIAANVGTPLILRSGRFSRFGGALRPIIAELETRSEAAVADGGNGAPIAEPVKGGETSQ
ncbi:MAG TPA: AAA family ATPase, partial [Tepidisphaeraceae bacterium]|nr:AAA family ATPase [Tepidisphaeraceae bacterium]